MQLEIIQYKTESDWKDPLMKYLADYIELISQSYVGDVFPTLDSAFGFIQSRMVEFMEVNPTYRKPIGLSLIYNRPSCCPHKIRLSYLNQFITIKQKSTHENNPNQTHQQGIGHQGQSNPTTTDTAQSG
ncbi:hypothetical protein [Algoriphagus resistens]|uniref:hypothetical protein n=1 Tax=Algoriphagus resistens TaxID=1750590 RepID=UPI0012FCFBD2|nr:hypothetical protein [Algoriphagus resistens]